MTAEYFSAGAGRGAVRLYDDRGGTVATTRPTSDRRALCRGRKPAGTARAARSEITATGG